MQDALGRGHGGHMVPLKNDYSASLIIMIPFNIKDSYWSTVHPGMHGRIKHRIILVRHGESTSNLELTTTGKTVEFNIDHALTALGSEQGTEIATFLKSVGLSGIDSIEVSPLYRAYSTALPTIEYGMQCKTVVDYNLIEKYMKDEYVCKLPENCVLMNFPFLTREERNEIDDQTEWIRKKDTHKSFTERVKQLMDRWKSIGSVDERKQTVVFTHSQVISHILSGFKYDYTFHIINGSISVIDIDEYDVINVHCMNYIKHLTHPTGMHTGFI